MAAINKNSAFEAQSIFSEQQSYWARNSDKVAENPTSHDDGTSEYAKRYPYLYPIIKRQWDAHRSSPHAVVITIIRVDGALQLLSNSQEQLALNLALDTPQDRERLMRFKKFRFYNLFSNDRDIYLLAFGGMTQAAFLITSELLSFVFDIGPTDPIEVVEFQLYQPPRF